MKALRDISGEIPVKLILIVLMVVLIGAGAFMKFGMKGKGAEKKVELSEWKLDEFIVNLADKNESRYLKVCVVLEVEGSLKSGGGHSDEAVAYPEEAKVRDMIISVLSSKKYNELLTEKGKTTLKKELKNKVNSVLKKVKVHEVYFTSFAMQ